MKKAVVSFGSGVDSTTCLALAFEANGITDPLHSKD